MLTNYTDLLPYRDYSEHDVLQMYSFNGTGVGGRFVVAETGNQDPVNTAGNYSATSVGASYAGTVSLRYENPRKVRFATSGENKFAVLGLTLYGTVEQDNNGQLFKYNPHLKAENSVVISGETTPIATAGYFRLSARAYTGTPIPGYVGVIHNTEPGKVAFVSSPSSSDLVVCKVLSSSGSAFGGYADVKLMLG